MKKISNIRTILLLCATLLLGSCDLTETMQVEADKAMIFGSESGLSLCLFFLPGITNTLYGLQSRRNV